MSKSVIPYESIGRSHNDFFLHGGFPLSWIVDALEMPGSTGRVALACYWVWGMREKKTTFALPTARVCEVFRVTRWTVYRGLDRLEEAGMLHQKRRKGHNRVVTLVGV